MALAGDVAGVSCAEPTFEKVREDGLDGRDDSGRVSESRVPSEELSWAEAASCDSVVAVDRVNWPCLFLSRGV